MAARPLVTVQGADGEPAGQVTLPAVFSAPIRPDVVLQVLTNEPDESEPAQLPPKILKMGVVPVSLGRRGG